MNDILLIILTVISAICSIINMFNFRDYKRTKIKNEVLGVENKNCKEENQRLKFKLEEYEQRRIDCNNKSSTEYTS